MRSPGIDLAAVRADTPGCVHQVFLDSAGSSLPPTPVLDTVIGHLRREAEIGGYRACEERDEELEQGYGVFADLLDCEPADVAFTDSATRAWLSLLDSVPLSRGDRVLISEVEYGANAVALLRLTERTGAELGVIASDESGQISVPALRAALDDRVKLVSLVHVPTNGGLVNPVHEVVDAVHDAGALVLLDASQSIGQLPVRMRDTGVDMLSGAGRKWLRGPRGTGFLAVRRAAADRLWPRLIDHGGALWEAPGRYRLRSDARVYQLRESGIAERLGLIAAARYAMALGIDAIAATVTDLAAQLRAGLAELPGVRVHDLGRHHCGLVSFTVNGLPPEAVRRVLGEHDITVRVRLADSARIDMHKRGLSALVRASPHYFVAPEQIDRFVAAVATLPGLDITAA